MALFSNKKKGNKSASILHKEAIFDCCIKYKYKPGHSDKHEIEEIANAMIDNEFPVYVYGFYVASGEPQGKINPKVSFMDKDKGVIVITNLRLFFRDRHIGSQASRIIYLRDIETVDTRSTYSFGTMIVRVQTCTTSLAIYCDKKQLKNLEHILNDAVLQSHATVDANHSNYQVSTADEIEKFKALLDSGAITQDEFDAKKKQLLGL